MEWENLSDVRGEENIRIMINLDYIMIKIGFHSYISFLDIYPQALSFLLSLP